MEIQSPPKRVTRARAAATTIKTEPTIRIATSGAKAKAAGTAPAAATKRKTRADDSFAGDLVEEKNISEPEKPKTTRGRPKKVVATHAEEELQIEQEMHIPAKPTRGRPRKVVEDKTALEPLRSSRGRAKGAQVAEEAADEPQATKKLSRGRAPVDVNAKAHAKKTVTFHEMHEPDKENILPSITIQNKGKQVEPGIGLKAKPIRKPTTAPRATRGQATAPEKPEAPKEKSPLSPKKATQVTAARDVGSDDELATMEKTPMKMLTKSPSKAAGSMFVTAKRLDFTTSIIANKAIPSSQRDHATSTMGSPARRMPQSPFKDALKISPKRLNVGDSRITSLFSPSISGLSTSNAQFKSSLLQSPARRPPSPFKNSGPASPVRSGPFNGSPKAHTFSVSRFATPRTLNKAASRPGRIPFASVGRQPSLILPTTTIPTSGSTSFRPFSGRLSSIVSRNADPALTDDIQTSESLISSENLAATAIEEDEPSVDPLSADLMDADDAQLKDQASEDDQSTTPTNSPPRHSVGNLDLRFEEADPFEDSDSEDELASNSPSYSPVPFGNFKNLATPSKPIPFTPISKTPRTALVQRLQAEHAQNRAQSESTKADRDQAAFMPLNRQLSDWIDVNPEHVEKMVEPFPILDSCDQPFEVNFDQNIEPSLAQSSFFDDEMLTLEESATNDTILEAIDFAPTELDDEDLALAAEADEMSLIDVEELDDEVDLLPAAVQADTLSEASQEYGDENDIPIDPAILQLDAPPTVAVQPRFVTPTRVLTERVFHTVSKVPLKPEAAESPIKFTAHKRSASASKLPVQRAAPPPPGSRSKFEQNISDDLLTPTKSMAWSTSVTPNKTPRRDLNDHVLKGAVVFVDVHTTEGADASAVFVELLGQMGAKCVRAWTWNANSSNSETSEGNAACKIGITHVVFKDGGKRTLEKVRESNGVVLCVGVSWILDCERSNAWLDEAPYTIDTSFVPRGGHRRRKSMEPRALANMNGRLVSTPGRTASGSYTMSPTKEFLNIPDTPGASLKLNRRASTQWVRSPSQNDDTDMPALSPIPATPAAETISAYAEHVLDGEGLEGVTPYSSRQEELVQRTAPPKQTLKGYGELGRINEGQNGDLMQRLLLARRKSLQWAPKVGSPLARGASYGA